MEYWHNNTTLVNEYANNKIRVTLYYGGQRQYSISTIKNTPKDKDKDKFIKETLGYLRDQKKFVKPTHGVCHYV